MARASRMKVFQTILDGGLLPLFYSGDVDVAINVTEACAQSGAKAVEFTNRGEGAHAVFQSLAQHFRKADPSVLLGVGSIQDAPTAALFIAAGAQYIVGPNFNEEIARMCNRQKIAYIPGCATETEIARAEEWGAEICKIFPAGQVGGPEFVRAVMGPCPWHRLLPTGGVDATEESVTEWIKAGAAVIGMGSKLISVKAVEARDFTGIASMVEKILGWIRKARGVPLFLGVEHAGLYPHGKATGAEMAAWYEQTFGFTSTEGKTSFFLSGGGVGRIEIDKESSKKPLHIAIRVSNFEDAVTALKAKGVALLEPSIKPESKAVYLQDPDPDGNLIHLLWTKN